MTGYIRDSKGSATILTLLISAVIITIGIGFNWIVKEHLKAAEGLKKKSEAMLDAKSAYDSIVYSIITGTMTSKEIVLTRGRDLLGISKIPLDGKNVVLKDGINISLQDSSGMLSLYTIDTGAMERLMKIVYEGKDVPTGIMDSFMDWIDSDKFVRINGAEESFYIGEGKPYVPRNYFIQYKEEMGFIRGMNEELYKKISTYITILPNTGFNPNTASDEVLMAYLDINRDVLDALKAHMSEKAIISDSELFSITGRTIASKTEGVYFFPSRLIEMTINAGSPRTVFSIKAGIDTRQNEHYPYSIVYWKEE